VKDTLLPDRWRGALSPGLAAASLGEAGGSTA
jgi:hypothetical protein